MPLSLFARETVRALFAALERFTPVVAVTFKVPTPEIPTVKSPVPIVLPPETRVRFPEVVAALFRVMVPAPEFQSFTSPMGPVRLKAPSAAIFPVVVELPMVSRPEVTRLLSSPVARPSPAEPAPKLIAVVTVVGERVIPPWAVTVDPTTMSSATKTTEPFEAPPEVMGAEMVRIPVPLSILITGVAAPSVKAPFTVKAPPLFFKYKPLLVEPAPNRGMDTGKRVPGIPTCPVELKAKVPVPDKVMSLVPEPPWVTVPVPKFRVKFLFKAKVRLPPAPENPEVRLPLKLLTVKWVPKFTATAPDPRVMAAVDVARPTVTVPVLVKLPRVAALRL